MIVTVAAKKLITSMIIVLIAQQVILCCCSHEPPVADEPLEIVELNDDLVVLNKPSSIPVSILLRPAATHNMCFI